MRAIFGVLSLLIVLVIVGSLAKKQLGALGAGGASTGSAAASSQTVPQRAQSMQDKARDDTVRALQQGADRTQRSTDTP